MADGINAPEDPAGIFNEIDPETAAGHNSDQEGNTSDGSDLEATVLGVTYTIGIIKTIGTPNLGIIEFVAQRVEQYRPLFLACFTCDLVYTYGFFEFCHIFLDLIDRMGV
jgi:hypothetical protein